MRWLLAFFVETLVGFAVWKVAVYGNSKSFWIAALCWFVFWILLDFYKSVKIEIQNY